MRPLAIFFNPRARVYNLRLLLLTDITLIAVPGARTLVYHPTLQLVCGVLVAIHHIFALFQWSITGLAFIDLAAVLTECGVLFHEATRLFEIFPLIYAGGANYKEALAAAPTLLVPIFLAVSAAFRLATILRAPERFYRQRFTLLGGCDPVFPPYNPMSILLNRSLARPLVRGESPVVIFARAFIISCIGIGVPVFAFYSLVVTPAHAQVYTKNIPAYPWIDSPLTGNASISLEVFPQNISDSTGFWNQNSVTATVDQRPGYDSFVQNCTFSSYTNVITCPRGWVEIGSISLTVPIHPTWRGVYLRVNPWYSTRGINPGPNPLPVPLFAGSHLAGILSWTARFMLSPTAWQYQPHISALQPDPTAPINETNVARLTLLQSYDAFSPATYLQDTTDASVLAGISNVGGFWTIVNGAFALFFGANIIYFAFGRRPLSALGAVHLFQQRSLQRRWHEDFPALLTEGGLPGSQSAGIVAFIRERLVDVGDDPLSHEEGEGIAPGVDHNAPTIHQVATSADSNDPDLESGEEEKHVRSLSQSLLLQEGSL